MIKKYVALFLLIVCGPASSAMAQTDIVGEVLGATSQEPLSGATIALYSQEDSTLVTETVTNDIGEFTLEGISDGVYNLEISYLGFVTQEMEVEIDGEEEVDLDEIELATAPVLPEGVTDIVGEVLGETSQEPLSGATIALYSQEDSTLVTETVTNDIGEFTLEGVSDGVYNLEISYVGFVTQEMEVEIDGEEQVDLDEIELAPAPVLPEEEEEVDPDVIEQAPAPVLLEGVTDIVGEVFEETSQESLYGATIALYSQEDSTLVTGTVTNDIGEFTIEGVPDGVYNLEISYVGFITQEMEVEVDGEEEVDLDVIELAPTPVLLEGVTVTGQAAQMVSTLDRRVYDVEQDVLSETASASEVLQNISIISVDINGAISLRGTDNITIFINGRPSAMLRRNAAAVLAQLPASSIERIEVITNPSARYRPDGVGGIINIVMREDARQGLNGRLYANGGTEQRYNAGLDLNYGTEAFNIFGNYGLRHAKGTNEFFDQRVFRLPNQLRTGSYDELGQSTIDELSHTVSTGINFNFNDYNVLEIAGTYFTQSSDHAGSADISIFEDADITPSERFVNNQTNEEFEGEGEASLAYEHIFKNSEDHSLTLEGAYAAYSEHEDLQFDEVYSIPSAITLVEKTYVAKSGNQAELVLDYATPLGEEAELEAGYTGEFIDDDIRYTNNGALSRFLYNQEIHAFYGLFTLSFGDLFVSAGARAEQTNITSELKLPTASKTPNDYFKVFPSLQIGYDLDDTRQLFLTYSKRITRPESDQLNPNPEFTDPRNAEAGNPLLKPEQIHSFEFGYQAISEEITFTPTVYYRYLYDAFTTIRSSLGDSVILTTATNLDKQHAAGFETVLSLSVSENANLDLAGNIFYTNIDATNLGYSDNRSVVTGDLRANLLYKLTSSTTLQLNAFYYFPEITPQGRRDRYFFLNGGLSQDLFKKRAALTVTATDIFHTYEENRTIDSAILQQFAGIKRKMPVLFFGFSWRFRSFQQEGGLGFEGEGLRR